MTEVKHTPGPWRLKTTGNYGNTIEARTGDDASGYPRFSVVCTYQSALPRGNYTFDFEDENAQANGNLIAAAPDLLQMLKVAQFWLDIDGRYDMQGINAAIAKAEGRA